MNKQSRDILNEGTLNFTIESRVLRELGERLVKQPEVALLELIKNAYDADARVCEIVDERPQCIHVLDDGNGMTFDQFTNGWMRIGTSAKEHSPTSTVFCRLITGEKGIGRFAVRFLGQSLRLESVAFDNTYEALTLLTADFYWPDFDRNQDLGKIKVPFQLVRADKHAKPGTRLIINELRPTTDKITFQTVRTGCIGIVTPYQSLLPQAKATRGRPRKITEDPGFSLLIKAADVEVEDGDGDLASTILDSFVLRSVLELDGNRLKLSVYRQSGAKPWLNINDHYANTIGPVYADIRFFPKRKGTFSNTGVDGRRAYSWIQEHSGVAIFDRRFRVHPYGTKSDDWLSLSADTARRERDPSSTVARKHFPMDEVTRRSTTLNYMLRLPYPLQIVGIVQVEGRRSVAESNGDEGLVVSADREGFADNAAFKSLRNVVRGALEAIAYADRELQKEEKQIQRDALVNELRDEAQNAIREIEANPSIAPDDKIRIVEQLTATQSLVETHEEQSRQREAALETMSLLGVVAGFMTHEFGTAFDELGKAQKKLAGLARQNETLRSASESIALHVEKLRDFIDYSQGYVRGASRRPDKAYEVLPRIKQVIRVFGKYASDRDINIVVDIEGDVLAPLVPVSLYNGISLNLFTNALKAITARTGNARRRIAFRSWNDNRRHFLEVSDTGVGIPVALRKRVFDALFTTTSSNSDPLGSGLGLGLSLVKRAVEAFGGQVEVVDPPAGFSTCVRVTLPLGGSH